MYSVSISPLDQATYLDFELRLPWPERQAKISRVAGFVAREYVVGRNPQHSPNLLEELITHREMHETTSILEERKTIFQAVVTHCEKNGPATPLFSGRTGNLPLNGVAPHISEDGRIWASPAQLVQQSMGQSMNNPFNYIYKRFMQYHQKDRFVPALVIVDGTLVEQAHGNTYDKTSWRPTTQEALGCLAAYYYFSPQHFRM